MNGPHLPAFPVLLLVNGPHLFLSFFLLGLGGVKVLCGLRSLFSGNGVFWVGLNSMCSPLVIFREEGTGERLGTLLTIWRGIELARAN